MAQQPLKSLLRQLHPEITAALASGIAEPSRSDEALTQALKQALALVDVKVLDHFVIGAGDAMSFAERWLI